MSAPSLAGMYLVKLAVLLVLIGGVSHTDSNGMKVLDHYDYYYYNSVCSVVLVVPCVLLWCCSCRVVCCVVLVVCLCV